MIASLEEDRPYFNIPLFSFIFGKKKERKAAVIPVSDDFPEEAITMESYKPGTRRAREIAWET